MVVNQCHEVSFLGFGYSANNNRSCKFLRWEYDHVPIVLFALVGSRGSGEDVWSRVGFSRYVVNDKVVFLQVHMPPGRSLVEVLWGLPILEIHVIGKDDKGEPGPPQVMSPMG
jgi:hypothetical protein